LPVECAAEFKYAPTDWLKTSGFDKIQNTHHAGGEELEANSYQIAGNKAYSPIQLRQ